MSLGFKRLMTSEPHAMRAWREMAVWWSASLSGRFIPSPNKDPAFPDKSESLSVELLLEPKPRPPARNYPGFLRKGTISWKCLQRVRSVIGHYKFSVYLSNGCRVNRVGLLGLDCQLFLRPQLVPHSEHCTINHRPKHKDVRPRCM